MSSYHKNQLKIMKFLFSVLSLFFLILTCSYFWNRKRCFEYDIVSKKLCSNENKNIFVFLRFKYTKLIILCHVPKFISRKNIFILPNCHFVVDRKLKTKNAKTSSELILKGQITRNIHCEKFLRLWQETYGSWKIFRYFAQFKNECNTHFDVKRKLHWIPEKTIISSTQSQFSFSFSYIADQISFVYGFNKLRVLL
jgi:hypothetical protein